MVNRILTCKVSGFLIFLGVMALVFHLTFNVIGEALRGLFARWIGTASLAADRLLEVWDAPVLLRSLILEGLFPGVGSVLSFVPIIGTLFFFLSLMEESGYLSYVAVLMDKPMRRIGLTGRAVVPLISGFGCNVPAILTAGSLLKGREKITVIAMVPFMSCSARLPIYAMFISAFFENRRLLALAGVYLAGIAVSIVTAFLLKRFSGTADCFNSPVSQKLRLPSAKNVSRTVMQNCAGFVKKVFTVILLASVIIWFLRTFGTGLQPVSDTGDSLLASLGRAAAPVFAPLGFGDWRASSALISGLFAKETIISTLAMLSASGGSAAVYTAAFADGSAALFAEIFTPLSAFCFMVFCLLYIPCIPALAAVRQEIGSIKYCLALCAFQLTIAWAVSFLLFQAVGFIMQI